MNRLLKKVCSLALSEHTILILIIVFATLIRFYKINNPVADWHSFRQADTASVTRTYVERGINLLIPRYHDISTTQTGLFNPNGYRFVEFPTYNLLNAIAYKAFPKISLEVWGRLLSIFFALISTFLLYFLGKRFISKWGGLAAAFFYAFTPFNIYFTRVILPEPFAVCLTLISLWFFVEFIDKNKNLYLLISTIFFALALLEKPFMAFYGLPMLYLAIQKFGLKGTLTSKKLITAFMLLFLPFILWRWWESKFPEGVPFYKWLFNGDGIRFKPAFWRWIFGERLGNLILGIWGLVPFSIGLLSFKKKNLFVAFMLIAMFVYVSVVATANVRHDYYQTIVMPAIALTLGQGVDYVLFSGKFNKFLALSVLGFSTLMMLGLGWYQIKGDYDINHPEIIEAGGEIQKITPKNALVIAPYNGDTAFLYQTDRWGWPVVDRPINELIQKGASYYVSVNFDTQTQEFIREFKTVERTKDYVILDLRSPLPQNKK